MTHFSARAGTHVDAPRRFSCRSPWHPTGLPLEVLIRDARVVDLISRQEGLSTDDPAQMELSEDVRVP